MNSIIKNEFSEIACSASGNVIYQFWFKGSEHLSECEFLEQVDTLFNTAVVFKSKILYIDAFSFCYPISEKSFQQIKEQFYRCNIKQVGIVLSSDQLGKFQILKLIKTISAPGITLTTFLTSGEGEFWISLRDSIIWN